jgi:uncharacterized protein (DUF1501 family)
LLNSVDNQVCERFGVHPNLPTMQQLFNDGDLLFFANTGVLTKPTDKERYGRDTVTQLFAHNWMQRAAQRIDPLKDEDGTGILGRIRDVLTKQGLSVGAFSLDTNSISLIGEPGLAASPMILSNNGVTVFNSDASSDDMASAISSINGETESHSGVFGEWFSDTLTKSLSHNQLLYDTISDKTTETEFPNSHLGRQLSMVSKMIDSREERGTDADVFFISKGGWDTHSQVLMNQVNLFSDVDASLKAFADEMQTKGVWDNVVLMETSDFARTLTPNTGEGTDHAWGGNYFRLGGSVKGGQIAGTYPHGIVEGSDLNIGRGRIIPTQSWESVFLPIAQWAGVGEDDFDYICPNRANFPPEHFYGSDELLQEVTNPPTGSPTSSPIAPTPPPTMSPVTASPVTASPVTASPVTASPVTASPVTASPVTASPVTASPVTASPATASPVTASPVTPATASPVTASPVTTSPVTASPVTASPVTPVTASPVTASPVTASPVTPATASPVTASPVTASPVTPATASPVTSSPTASP